MNREDTRKAAEVMLAYADGAEIEFSHKDNNAWYKFTNEGAPCWNFNIYNYRVVKSDGQKLYEAYKQRENVLLTWNTVNHDRWEAIAQAAKEVFK